MRGNVGKLDLPLAITLYDEMLARNVPQARIDDDVAGGVSSDDVSARMQLRVVTVLVDEKEFVAQKNAALVFRE